jgi:hypothetical protein
MPMSRAAPAASGRRVVGEAQALLACGEIAGPGGNDTRRPAGGRKGNKGEGNVE